MVIGGSGNGEAISANKVKGTRAVLVWNEETARLGREHNNANVISLGAREHPVADAVRFVEVFFATAVQRGPAACPPPRDDQRVRANRPGTPALTL